MKNALLFVLTLFCSLQIYAQNLKVENALESLAEYNLQDVNTFAQPDAAGKVWGRLFQFGRNVPFDYTEALSTYPGRVVGNDSRVWSREFFMRIDSDQGRFDWYQDGLAADTWHTVVAQATDAPASYLGKNNGDPCPRGYHLPTKAELAAFFPSTFAAANFGGELGKKTIAEELTINGKTETYQAEYLSNAKHVIYGIKYIGGENTLRTAYRWMWNGTGVSVTSRMIGAAAKYKSVEDIIIRDFWEDNMAEYVKREIPASGMISGYTGMAMQRYDNIYIWSAQAGSDQGYAWAVWGYPADDEGYSEGGIAPYHEAVGRYSAVSVRCVRDVQQAPTMVKVTLRPQSGSIEDAGTIEAEYSIDGALAVGIDSQASVPLGAKLTVRAIPAHGYKVKNLLINNTYPFIEGEALAEITDPLSRVVTYVKERIDKDFLFEPFFVDAKPDTRLVCKASFVNDQGVIEDLSQGKFSVFAQNEALEEQPYTPQDGLYLIPAADLFFVRFVPPSSDMVINQWMLNGVVVDGKDALGQTGCISAEDMRKALGIGSGHPFETELRLLVVCQQTASTHRIDADKAMLHPSQFEGVAMLSVPSNLIGQKAFVYNAAGVLMQRLPLTALSQAIDLGMHPAGIYFVRVGQYMFSLLRR